MSKSSPNEKIFPNSGGPFSINLSTKNNKNNSLGITKETAALFPLDTALYLAKWVGAGIISESDPLRTSRAERYQNLLNDLVSIRKNQISDSKNNPSGNLSYLRNLESLLQQSGNILDQKQFSELQKILSDEINRTEEIDKSRLEKLNKEASEINNQMLEKIKNDTQTEDDMWKYRVLQMLLVASPLGFVGVFNYLEPLSHLLGPLFDSGLNFGEGLAHVVTSDALGPLGTIADKLELDVVFEWLGNDLPVISDFNNFLDSLIDTEIGQDLIGLASPLKSAPLVYLGIGAAYSLYRIGANEIPHYDNSKNAEKRIKKQLKGLFDEFEKDYRGKEPKEMARHLASKIIDAENKASKHQKLEEFIARGKDLEIFENIKIISGDKVKTISEIQKDLSTEDSTKKASEVMNYLKEKHPYDLEKLLRNFLAYQEIRQQNAQEVGAHNNSIIEEFQKAKESPLRFQKLCESQEKKLDQEFIFNLAKKELEIGDKKIEEVKNSGNAERERLCKNFEKRLLEKRFRTINETVRSKIPGTHPQEPKAEALDLNQQDKNR